MLRKAVKQATSPDPVFFAILLLALLLRTYHLGYPFWDYFASSQTFNLMVIRTYVHHGISLARPTLDWLALADPSRPSYFCGEFPWLHALAAIEMRLLPFGDWCTRLIPVALSLAGLWWIYGLTRRVIGLSAARFAALAWAVLPFSVFFGRAFMSDVPALSLAAGALNEFCSWLETRRPVHFLVFALLGSLAVLTKPQVVTFGVVLVYLAFLEFRWRVLTGWKLYIAAIVIVLPAILWIYHTRELSLAGAPPVIGTAIIGRSLRLWLQRSAWIEQWDRMFHSVLGPVALLSRQSVFSGLSETRVVGQFEWRQS
jgi:Dolichyl-phosphate-mannose-protein mannosyltransferase